MKNKVCCLIPAFNEARTISKVVAGAKKYIDDIIVVDDGSEDSTHTLAQEAGALVIRHSRNLGKGKALRTGFSYVLQNGFDAVITLDADGQHDPAEIVKFLSELNSNSGDIIIGTRFWKKTSIPMYRYIPNRIGIFCISKAAGCRIDDTQSGFRLYRREVLSRISLDTEGFETETEILIKAGKMGFRICSLPITAIYHDNYKTHFRPVRDFYRISILVLKLSFFKGKDN